MDSPAREGVAGHFAITRSADAPFWRLWYRGSARFWVTSHNERYALNDIDPRFGQNFDFFGLLVSRRTSSTPSSLNISAHSVKSRSSAAKPSWWFASTVSYPGHQQRVGADFIQQANIALPGGDKAAHRDPLRQYESAASSWKPQSQRRLNNASPVRHSE